MELYVPLPSPPKKRPAEDSPALPSKRMRVDIVTSSPQQQLLVLPEGYTPRQVQFLNQIKPTYAARKHKTEKKKR